MPSGPWSVDFSCGQDIKRPGILAYEQESVSFPVCHNHAHSRIEYRVAIFFTLFAVGCWALIPVFPNNEPGAALHTIIHIHFELPLPVYKITARIVSEPGQDCKKNMVKKS